jgi:hypothetical protein
MRLAVAAADTVRLAVLAVRQVLAVLVAVMFRRQAVTLRLVVVQVAAVQVRQLLAVLTQMAATGQTA